MHAVPIAVTRCPIRLAFATPALAVVTRVAGGRGPGDGLRPRARGRCA